MLVFMMSFNMLLPEMNDYITRLGGADQKWLILGLWTFAAAIARPFSGKIADNISRKSVMYFGILVSILISFLYPFFLTVVGFLLLRFFHGFSTGFHPTGATALIADIVPRGKRGEAMGLFGVTISLGFSGGQAIGSPIKQTIGFDGLFFASGGLGLLSLLLLLAVREKEKKRLDDVIIDQPIEESSPDKLKLWQKIIPRIDEIIAPEVIHPSIIMFITAMLSGIYMMTVPDISEHLGMSNKGMFYMVNVIFMVVTRFLAGKFYDRYGARRNLNIGLTLMAIGTIITGTSTTVTQFLISSVVFGVAASICSPALFAWTADLANPKYKGRGMSTMFIALELGIVAGTFSSQMIYNNDPTNFIYLFIWAAALCAGGIIYLAFTRRSKWNEVRGEG
ncbi:MAG: MFS transporter [Crocinitomicaceae bacterium]